MYRNSIDNKTIQIMETIIKRLQRADKKALRSAAERQKTSQWVIPSPALFITKKGEISKNITNMLLNCRFDSAENKIYTGYYSGSGRFSKAGSAEKTVVSILDALGFAYTVGNDAPRGGVSGDFVKVSKKAFETLIKIK